LQQYEIGKLSINFVQVNFQCLKPLPSEEDLIGGESEYILTVPAAAGHKERLSATQHCAIIASAFSLHKLMQYMDNFPSHSIVQ